MKFLKEILMQDVDKVNLRLWGNLIGGVGMIFLALTVWWATKYIPLLAKSIAGTADREAGELAVSGLLLLALVLISYGLLNTAWRLVTDPGPEEDDW